MKDELSQYQIDEILKILDDMLEKGPWEESNFLKLIGKNISNIRSDFLKHIELSDMESLQKISKQPSNNNTEQQEIYISLYSSLGDKLISWERILLNLPRQTVSRPIYENEEDVKAAIRSRGNSVNEAYVAVQINKNAILMVDQDKTPVDKLGKPLLTLKDNAISLDKVHYFTHLSHRYEWSGGKLISKPD